MKTSQQKLFAIIRIAFGIVWAIDAAFKWTPAFLNGLSGMIGSMISGQPAVVADWLVFWSRIFSIDPFLFALIIALTESALAIGLVFDLFPKTIYIGGFVFSLLIWSVGEAFGGPYAASSTDIGTAIIYAFVFAALYFQRFTAPGSGSGME